jgi:nitrile hydratase
VSHDHHHDHDHDHDHGHHHPEPVSPAEARARAIESLLVEKGLIATEAIDALVQTYEQDIGPLKGARVVARAWVDPAFKARLLADATHAIAEVGVEPSLNQLVAVENTPTVHNLVVCTLCSCYPWAVLGLPPTWYKSFAYRSRAVVEPRAVLSEFGVELDESVEVRVWDSSAEVRYLVLPERPAGTEGLSEAELAELVSRDSMIGVARASAPALAPR